MQSCRSTSKVLPRLEAVRDVFVFCCFTGLAFSDVSTLTADKIVTDADGELWIRKHREDRRTQFDTTVGNPSPDYRKIFRPQENNRYRQTAARIIKPTMQRSYLKEIADLAGITKKLTTQVARHTFACLSLDNHVSIETISKMLGHSNIKTTQTYAKMQDKTIFGGYG